LLFCKKRREKKRKGGGYKKQKHYDIGPGIFTTQKESYKKKGGGITVTIKKEDSFKPLNMKREDTSGKKGGMSFRVRSQQGEEKLPHLPLAEKDEKRGEKHLTFVNIYEATTIKSSEG